MAAAPIDPTESIHPAHPFSFRRAAAILAAVVLVAVATMWHIGLLDGNFRAVVAGKCYRSAQLNAAEFKKEIEAHGIKSVLNLRGTQNKSAWYTNEVGVCDFEKIDHADINIGLGELPKPEALQQLVEKLETGPYPMLMHCHSGSDRSGLASAFYLHVVEKKPLEQAEAEQISWHFGHFGIGKAKSIDDFFELYHSTAHGQSLKEWLNRTYPAEYEKRVAEHSKISSD